MESTFQEITAQNDLGMDSSFERVWTGSIAMPAGEKAGTTRRRPILILGRRLSAQNANPLPAAFLEHLNLRISSLGE